MYKLFNAVKKANRKSNEAVAWATAGVLAKDKRYLEVCEKFGDMTDSYNNALMALTEELCKQRDEISSLKRKMYLYSNVGS